MRASREEFLIERIVGRYGDALGGTLTVKAAYQELKILSGKDFGQSESDWRGWLKDFLDNRNQNTR